jgi:hypothetical protein
LFPPEYLAVLDPFSEEAAKIAESSPPFDEIPREMIERAVNRVMWSGREGVVEPDLGSIRTEVISFYLMCQGIASVSYPYSREIRMISDSTRNTIRYRMYDLFKRGQEELCVKAVQRSIKLIELGSGEGAEPRIVIPPEDFYKLRDQELEKDGIDPLEDAVDDRVLRQYLPRYAVRWEDLAPLLKHRRVELAKLYLVKGWAVLTLKNLWDFYAGFISAKTEDYIQSVYERVAESGAPSKVLAEIGERISSLLPRETEFTERFARVPAKRLRPEFFPPCVNRALGGAGTGLRNYAITVLLTSFLSYARIAPSGRVTPRMADFIDDISVVREEIVPPIFEAAERCSPPLFRDQPQEKASIFYHLGFGMTTDPNLSDSGKSKWYRPPNCAKIQMSAAPLCNPDEFCRKIKNPLTYYFRKIYEQGRRGAGG